MLRPLTNVVVCRVAFLLLLAIGLCVQPVLAANCDLGDVLTALDGGDSDAGSDADAGPDVAVDARDCCPDATCIDCCLHVTAMPIDLSLNLAMPEFVSVDHFITAEFRLSAYPVDIRPPITG